jgi:hypothetical protein
MLLLSGGCMTSTLLDDAERTTLSDARVSGQFPKVEGEPGGGAIVVCYSVSRGHLWFRIPLDPNDNPPAPFAYAGDARLGKNVLADLSSDQRQALSPAFSKLSYGSGWSPTNSPRFEPKDVYADYTYHVADEQVDLRLYRRDASGKLDLLPINEKWPDDARVLVLPKWPPRPPEDLQAAKVRAGFLLPLAIPIDILTTPIVLLVWLMAGGLH